MPALVGKKENAMLIPAIVLGTAAAGYFIHKKRALTAEEKQIYTSALNSKKLTPAQLRTLADSFDKAGHKAEAKLLRQRAALREMPEDLKAARSAAFKTAMTWKDPAKVEAFAKVVEGEGATGTAATLRQYAAGLRASKAA